jgi:peptidyl-dipeptidase Dcp
MPAALRDRLLKARNYDKGYEMATLLSSTIVDVALHDEPAPADPIRTEAEVLERIGLPHAIQPFALVPHFQHVFATNEYAAGTYSYLWSEVMARDAHAAFEELGDFFDPELARSLQDNILAVSGSRDEGESYRAFRGRMPTVEPLLRGQGLLTDAA